MAPYQVIDSDGMYYTMTTKFGFPELNTGSEYFYKTLISGESRSSKTEGFISVQSAGMGVDNFVTITPEFIRDLQEFLTYKFKEDLEYFDDIENNIRRVLDDIATKDISLLTERVNRLNEALNSFTVNMISADVAFLLHTTKCTVASLKETLEEMIDYAEEIKSRDDLGDMAEKENMVINKFSKRFYFSLTIINSNLINIITEQDKVKEEMGNISRVLK